MGKKLAFGITVVVLLAGLMGASFLQINTERKFILDGAKYTLKPYTGVGAYVLKHGTIVKIVDNQPVVVGHFDDDTGAEYPGTVQIEEVK